MNTSNQTKRAYQQVELWKRKELIDTVNKKEETMKECAKRLGINYCTAKHIMKVFRKSGSYETDLMKKKKEKEQALRERVLNDTQFADYIKFDYPQYKQMNQGIESHESTSHDTDEQVPEQVSMHNCGFMAPQTNQPKLFLPSPPMLPQNSQMQFSM
mmetsp:Transcript_36457/g.36063  ORF Transcript_36457/g.36063 Transcript_36457/m.36063 type:complete len:157 (+) Transcript_36457:23-493(+)|eukprot:CAMPEP_0197005778 /NCGR_PEP_ID=MMETSP1380-20130617/31248_1 /TAXON_ID=5936 /ORGANISM="Euplotes crassus, Strain CT5" /LENGTH=156 /DNA_ID=CAMNT_0042425045 /DNA_START=10 /DNA_END=480 /DNA_ORIENTATION=+